MLKTTSRLLRQAGFTRPGVLINEDQARNNIRLMIRKARRCGALFRPHFKTHQSAAIARWFADEGTEAITVSSVGMAEYFAANGWNDITIAFLLNPLEWPRLEILAGTLADRGGSLGITIDSLAAAEGIARRPDLPVSVWIKIDAGYGRTGIPCQDRLAVQNVIDRLEKSPRVKGLLTHSGQSYQADSTKDLAGIWDRTVRRLESLRTELTGVDDLLISLGDTPCCRFLPDLKGAREIRPGNFVFFDLMQLEKGVCREDELAAAAVCPVVGLYPERNRIVVHGGTVHLSREHLTDSHNQICFGYLGALLPSASSTDAGEWSWKQKVLKTAPVVSLSQEHGIIQVSPGFFEENLNQLEIGDLVLIWPVHSCITCDLAAEYRTISGVILDKK